MGNNVIKILSFPAQHPYVSKFNVGQIEFVNPDSNYFNEPNKCSEKYLNIKHPPDSYDLAHFHFSFDRLGLHEFEVLLNYLRKMHKPIIWTSHSKESQRIKNFEQGNYQRLLYKYSDKIISPTVGCAKWLEKNYGKHKNTIDVIPLGYMANPDDINKFSKEVNKDRNKYVMLIGDFRENKEFLQSIINFLQCSELKKVKLQLIYKPINIYEGDNNNFNFEKLFFFLIIQNNRIIHISSSEISNDVIAKAFLMSHAVILPYKWGTHSGQIELAKDCGCHVISSNVGYYEEQWERICFWDISDNMYSEYPTRYTNALIDVYHRDRLTPAGKSRKVEFESIYKSHLKIYEEISK